MNARGMLKIQNQLSLASPISATLEVQDTIGLYSNINTHIYSRHTNGFSVGLVVQNLSPLPNRIAGYFEASGVDKAHAIVVPDGGGNVGFGITFPNTSYRMEVFGNSNFNGNIDGAGTFNYVSDAGYKTDIDSISNAIDLISDLKPYTYYFDTTNSVGLAFDSRRQYGFIAQDVETVLPDLVQNTTRDAVVDTAGTQIYPAYSYKSLNYNAFIAILTKGMQEQQRAIDSLRQESSSSDSLIAALQAENESLENRITAIETCLMNTGLCNGTSAISPQTGQSYNGIGGSTPTGTIQQQNVTLSNMERVVLDQNVPNPFAEQTIISYYLPETAQRAQMLFYDHNGRLINSVDLNGTGQGQLQVFANDLSNGMYNYVLVVDGEIKDSKQMVKTN
jgi:hypothetical protein